MRIWDFYFPILIQSEQYFLLFTLIILYILFLLFTRNKKISKITDFFVLVSFVYIFFLINLSFFPFHQVSQWNFSEHINLIPFSALGEGKRFLFSIILLIPAWFLLPYFLKNIKKSLIFWVSLCVIIEFLQLLVLFISSEIWFGSNRPFSIDDIFLRIVWFLIWLLIFVIWRKLLKKYKN